MVHYREMFNRLLKDTDLEIVQNRNWCYIIGKYLIHYKGDKILE